MLKVRSFWGVRTGGYAHFYIHRQYAESMKGGMLMNNKHIATYGNENYICNHINFIIADSFFHKSRVTAIALAVTLND